jgi:hypothetical protein
VRILAGQGFTEHSGLEITKDQSIFYLIVLIGRPK